MELGNQTITTIEQAFRLMDPAAQDHAKRVSAYAEAAFRKISIENYCRGRAFASRELLEKYAPEAAFSGLYHDIGKVSLPAETEDKDGTLHENAGADLLRELDPAWGKRKATEQKLILDGVLYHHSRKEDTPYLGRIIRLADLLDHRSMELRSEDPIGDALKELKTQVKTDETDALLFKGFLGSGAKLRKIFDRYRNETAAIPPVEPWIRRKASRPMELVYRRAELGDTGRTLWISDMRFRLAGDNSATYEETAALLKERNLGLKTGIYFLYEAVDTLKRFDACGIPADLLAVTLPQEFYTEKGLADRIGSVLLDEKTDGSRLLLIVPKELSERLEKNPTKTVLKNFSGAKEKGYRIYESSELEKMIGGKPTDWMREDAIVRDALKKEFSEAAPSPKGSLTKESTEPTPPNRVSLAKEPPEPAPSAKGSLTKETNGQPPMTNPESEAKK